MAKGAGCVADGEMAYDNSPRIEPKRSHPWFMDGTEVELFPNKKQAVEVSNSNLFPGLSNPNVSAWANASGFHSVSGHFTERLFDPEAAARTVNFDDRNIPSVGGGNMNMARKVIEDPFGNESLFGLSMSHSLEDPRSGLNYGGIRKVKVSQVKDSENIMSVSMGHVYTRTDNNAMSLAHAYKGDGNSISMGLTYNKGDDNILSISESYGREDNNFMSMGQVYNKGDENIGMGHTYKVDNNTISIGDTFSKSEDNVISMGQTYKGDDNTISMGQAFNKADNSIMSMSHTYDKGGDNAISMSHTFSKGDNSIVSMGQTYTKGDDNSISTGHIYNKGDENTISMGHTYNKGDDNNLSIGHSYNKGESNIISFGGFHDDDDDTNASGRLVCSYDLLMGQPSVHRSEAINEKKLIDSNADALIVNAQLASGSETVSKKKEDQKLNKKVPPNNFPSNVRSLLSTGMLDGVPVKYIAWSREVNLSFLFLLEIGLLSHDLSFSCYAC